MGFNLGKFLEILKTVGPVVGAIVPGLPPTLIPTIVEGIGEAQQLQGASSEDKKKHVMEMTRLSVQGINAAKPGTLNPADVEKAASLAIDTTVQVVKVAHGEITAPGTNAPETKK